MNIHVTDYQDPEIGTMFKCIAWKDTFENNEYGDYILSAELYENWDLNEVIEMIKILEAQHDTIFEELKKEKDGNNLET